MGGWDTVSFSLGSTYNDNTVYNTWLNRANNGGTKEFKEYLLSDGNNLQLFAKHFDGYQEGDMFVKESVVELADGRLLCFDADQAQAYIIDLENINENSDTIYMKVIKPNDTSVSYDKQIENIVKQLKVEIGGDKFKTKDGKKLNLDYITTNILASTSLSLYQEAKGITINSTTGETTTSIDTQDLKVICYENLSQLLNEDEEKDYYQTLLDSLGISIDNKGGIVDGTNVTTDLIKKINEISNILNSKSLTLSNTYRKNLIETVRKLSLSEIILIEKLNPGLLSTIGEFVGTYKATLYTDKYGRATSQQLQVGWADVMKEKADMLAENDPLAYLRFEDRPETQSNGSTLKCSIGDREYSIDLTSTNDANSTATNDDDGITYAYGNDGKFSSASFTAENGITYTFDKDGELIGITGGKADAARKLVTEDVPEAKASIEVLSYIENNQAQCVSQSTIDEYLDTFKNYFEDWGGTKFKCKQPDKALTFLAELRNPEVAYRLLSDTNVQKALQLVGEKKGTLAGGQGQTPEMYYIGEDNQIAMDANGNLLTKKMELTVSNVATHLSILTELYKSSRYDENGNYIAGDADRISDEHSMSSIEELLSGLTQGENVEFTDNMGAETVTAASTAAGATILSGSALICAKCGTITTIGLNSTTLSGSAQTLLKSSFSVMNTAEGSAVAAPVLSVLGLVAGGVAGGFAGAAIADAIIDNDTSGDFIDQDGNFCDNKASNFKTASITSGASVGVGAAAFLMFGLSSPIGWFCLGVGAVVGLGAWLYKKYGDKK